jgi:hypothetical protein
MSKYNITRNDRKDNSEEKYIVIRIDKGAKDVAFNRLIAEHYAMSLGFINRKASKEILEFIKQVEKED